MRDFIHLLDDLISSLRLSLSNINLTKSSSFDESDLSEPGVLLRSLLSSLDSNLRDISEIELAEFIWEESLSCCLDDVLFSTPFP